MKADCVVRAFLCHLCILLSLLPLEYSGKNRVKLIPGIFPLISTELSRDEIHIPLQNFL